MGILFWKRKRVMQETIDKYRPLSTKQIICGFKFFETQLFQPHLFSKNRTCILVFKHSNLDAFLLFVIIIVVFGCFQANQSIYLNLKAKSLNPSNWLKLYYYYYYYYLSEFVKQLEALVVVWEQLYIDVIQSHLITV